MEINFLPFKFQKKDLEYISSDHPKASGIKKQIQSTKYIAVWDLTVFWCLIQDILI